MAQPDPSIVLVVGSGGREHALTWSLAKSPKVARIYVAPGNGGIPGEPKAENVDIAAGDIEGLLAFARERGVGLTVIGPEDPLAAGVVDRFRAAGLSVFGPSQAAARLETSKAWARDFMARHGVPSPAFRVAETFEAASEAIRALGGRCVVKADGLAAGKGVVVCDSQDEALAAARDMLVEQAFGSAGARVLIEQRCEGPELSVMAVCDGERYVLLPSAQDHKRLLAGDHGPNTGGMGAYAPAPAASPELLDRVRREVVEPTLAGMRAEGAAFSGCLYCGLMLTETGPVVIEYNTRFGDPETQVQLPLLRSDLAELLLAAAEGRIDPEAFALAEGRSAVCVVLAAAGYPRQAETGRPITGIDAAETVPGVKVLHAGTRLDASGHVLSSGGRVLNVVCERGSLLDALRGAYEAIDDPESTPGPGGVGFEAMQYRRDIAYRAFASDA
ncbi:MAG: phosphoribosylamine--glycine ligase [Caldilineae bacterium]|nr:phosphoribosylamine--glycine ligase [Caldilineae bacterium]